jgi:hypothetical protein
VSCLEDDALMLERPELEQIGYARWRGSFELEVAADQVTSG